MANRVRMVLEIGGRYYFGKNLETRVRDFLPPLTTAPDNLHGWRRVRWLVDALPLTLKRRLWIIREPRRISYKTSRYVSFLRAMGIGRDLRKRRQISNPLLRDLAVDEILARTPRPRQHAETIPERPTIAETIAAEPSPTGNFIYYSDGSRITLQNNLQTPTSSGGTRTPDIGTAEREVDRLRRLRQQMDMWDPAPGVNNDNEPFY